MSKAITSAAFEILVDEGRLEWDTLIKDILPSYQSEDRIVQELATVSDLLSHRTGLQRADPLWLGAEGEFLLDQKKTFNISLRPVKSFRSDFQYNNWNYALAGEIIEHVTGETYPGRSSQAHIPQSRVRGLGLPATNLR